MRKNASTTEALASAGDISKLRRAIRKDEREREKARAHSDQIAAWQKEETRLRAELTIIQDKILHACEVEFDLSDDMTLAAAKTALKNLEKRAGKQSKPKRWNWLYY